MTQSDPSLPFQKLRVLEFTHAVMGPSAGLILADMGAEVIHIEPPGGDPTRRLKGFGAGYFSFFNRNKKSLAIDLKREQGRDAVLELAKTADVVLENFGPGTMDRLGLGWENLRAVNPALIYCAMKGFLSGPYEQRHAMDEVAQMMGGLAYMTGPPGQPLRAGASVIDIAGGMFAVIAVQAALLERTRTGRGRFVKSALFETTAFMMGQHMAYAAVTGAPAPPMPARVSAWSVYRAFPTRSGELVFIGIVSEKHWTRFCRVFDRADLLADPRFRDNNTRIEHREALLPDLEAMIARFDKQEILRRCAEAAIPFAPVSRPEDLFDDPQLNSGPGLLSTALPGGARAKLPRLPIEMTGANLGLRCDPPEVGAHNREILAELGYGPEQIEALAGSGPP